jgi:hypothetical protein
VISTTTTTTTTTQQCLDMAFFTSNLADASMEMADDNGDINDADAVTSSPYWRIRDMAHELVSSRIVEKSLSSSSSKRNKAQSEMSVSSLFDVDTCLARIRRDKAAVIRNAFEAAATAVLESFEKQTKEEETENELSFNESDLPAVLLDCKKLDDLRTESLVRAHDNKDWAKRKTSKLPVVGGSSSLSPTSRATGNTKTTSATATSATATTTTPTVKVKKAPTGTDSVKKAASSSTKDAPKFTRNTPASSAAALDSRLTSSRAILCTAANVAFDSLTPPHPIAGYEVDVSDVPQNPNRNQNSGSVSSSVSNMGAVVVEARTLGQRVESVAENAARRSARRYQFRKENIRYDHPKKSFLKVKNPFAWKEDNGAEDDGEDTDDESIFLPRQESITEAWGTVCLPRLLSVLMTGAGHAVYHDARWSSRHGRIASLLDELSRTEKSFGPHLIMTTEPELERFGQEFHGVNGHVRLLSTVNTESLRALKYTGSSEQRTKLRKQFPDATGLPEAPFHVIITSYANFLRDYLHFCHMPFEAVVIDDGVSWMSAAQADPNSPMGQLWENAIWSKSDQQIGLAGTFYKDWDYSVEDFDEETLKEAWIGLTARHRIITSSTLRIHSRSSVDLVPVSGLVNFVAPHYADVVREEWDRSRITTDAASMEHFRKLLTRSFVVHDPNSDEKDTFELAMRALKGQLSPPDRSDDPVAPELIPDETFVSDGKVAFSRRSALQWLGTPATSFLRYELGSVSFEHILDAMKISGVHGHLCEEIVTASSTTSSGATGQVTGTLAYRLAVRCGRHFGSEQGLRQHLSALHAPPGTWLCRTCGDDCITSQARTHHERSCGQPNGEFVKRFVFSYCQCFIFFWCS